MHRQQDSNSHLPLPTEQARGRTDELHTCLHTCLHPAHRLADALDELSGLDPLGYFARPVDEEAIPEYRTVIPDPMVRPTNSPRPQRPPVRLHATVPNRDAQP